MMLYPLLRACLFCFDAEKSHYLALRLLKSVYFEKLARRRLASFPQKPVKVFGLHFPNPVGLAAGFDKNGDYIPELQSLGFGFIEVGTVTPRPQKGNPKPRLFRVPAAYGIINRMGFNNKGVEHLVANLQKKRLPGIVGANIGKNSSTPLELAGDDYCFCLQKVYPWVDYVTVNISSPNTPGLRHLQSAHYLNQLLAQLDLAQEQLWQQGHRKIPLLIKIDPDLNDEVIAELAQTLLLHRVDGVIATNTSLNHRLVSHLPHGEEAGGLSGEPLFQRSTLVLSQLVELLKGKLPVIGVGGIQSAENALDKFSAGASLIQIYTGLIYQGPSLIKNILKNL